MDLSHHEFKTCKATTTVTEVWDGASSSNENRPKLIETGEYQEAHPECELLAIYTPDSSITSRIVDMILLMHSKETI